MQKNDLVQLASQDPQAAIKILLTRIEQQPTALDYQLYAHCLLKIDQANAAQVAYEQALTLDASLLGAHFGYAQALQKLHDFSRAVVHLKRCLEAEPNETVFWFQLGSCYLQLNKIEQAKQALEKVLFHHPHHLEALINLANCFMQEKNFPQAIHYFATACRIDDHYLPAQYNLACALMEYKRYPQARDQFEHYLKKAPHDLEAQYHLGFVYLMLDQLTQASDCFHQLLAINTEHQLAMHNLASIALKQQEASVALGYYQRILTLTPDDEIANYMHAALAQKKPPIQAPNTYIKNLFDHYAPHFDQHLTEALNYQTPSLLYQHWTKHFAPAANYYAILDLGCGTGLMADWLKPHAKKLVGVDLAPQMLAQAEKKQLYDKLHEAEILSYLNATSDHYDLVVLADVCVYFGDLTALIKALALKTDQLLFSIESTQQPHYVLSVHGRYQHPLEPLLALLQQSGFCCKTKRQVTLRTQDHQPVLGDLIFGFRDPHTQRA